MRPPEVVIFPTDHPRLERGLTRIFRNAAVMPSRTVDIAEQASRGAMQGAVESEKDTVSLIRPTVTGIINSLARTKADPEDTIHGISRGIIHIAAESGVDLGVAVRETVESVQDAAHRFGLDEKEAALEAAHYALTAVGEIDMVEEERIRQALSREMLASLVHTKPGRQRKPPPPGKIPADDSSHPAAGS
jgi:hypothetical protein